VQGIDGAPREAPRGIDGALSVAPREAPRVAPRVALRGIDGGPRGAPSVAPRVAPRHGPREAPCSIAGAARYEDGAPLAKRCMGRPTDSRVSTNPENASFAWFTSSCTSSSRNSGRSSKTNPPTADSMA
jgi:hypothetical protein